jgi:hypothetical protein
MYSSADPVSSETSVVVLNVMDGFGRKAVYQKRMVMWHREPIAESMGSIPFIYYQSGQ